MKQPAEDLLPIEETAVEVAGAGGDAAGEVCGGDVDPLRDEEEDLQQRPRFEVDPIGAVGREVFEVGVELPRRQVEGPQRRVEFEGVAKDHPVFVTIDAGVDPQDRLAGGANEGDAFGDGPPLEVVSHRLDRVRRVRLAGR